MTRGLQRMQSLSFCRRLLSRVRERFYLKDELVVHPSRWNITEKSVRYLRELPVVEKIYRDSNNKQSPEDPDEVPCA